MWSLGCLLICWNPPAVSSKYISHPHYNHTASQSRDITTGELRPSLIMGVRCYRIRLFPFEALERSFAFLQYLAASWISSKNNEVKGVWMKLLTELLLPAAVAAKTEVNVPAVRNFVNTAFPYLIDLYKVVPHVLTVSSYNCTFLKCMLMPFRLYILTSYRPL